MNGEANGKCEVASPHVAMITFPAMGHALPMIALSVQLAKRGTRVSFVTSSCMTEHLEPRLKASLAGSCWENWVKLEPLDDGLSPEHLVFECGKPRHLTSMGGPGYSSMMMLKPLTELLRRWKEDKVQRNADVPDLLVVDHLTPAGRRAAEAVDYPFIVYASMPLEQLQLAGIVEPRNFATMLRSWKYRLGLLCGFIATPERAINHGPDEPLTLVNACMGVETPVHLPPHIRVVGRPQLMDKSLREKVSLEPFASFLEAHETVVVVTFGSRLRPSPHQIREMLAAFEIWLGRDSQHGVIWSMKEVDQQENLPGELPKGLLVSKWIPQQSLLLHSRVKAVICHCGLGGFSEVVEAGKPMISMPFAGDQPMLARVAQEAGFCIGVDRFRITARSFLHTLETILGDPRYLVAAKRVQNELFRESYGNRDAVEVEAMATYGPPRSRPMRGSPTLKSLALPLSLAIGAAFIICVSTSLKGPK